MSYNVAEWTVESAALDWLRGLRWETAFGPDLAFDGPRPERVDYADVILAHRLQSALARINSEVPPAALEQAVRAATRIESPSLIENNRRFHRLLADGVPVEYPGRGGRIVHARVGLLDFAEPDNNDWLAVNQFTVIEGRKNRRLDVTLFVNGLPLGVIELKNLADEHATIRHAFNQLQTYKQDIPSLFAFNEFLAISDGLEARSGNAHRGLGAFHALADHRRRRAGFPEYAANGSHAPGCLRPPALAGPDPILHRV